MTFTRWIKKRPRSKAETQRIYGGDYADWLRAQPCILAGQHECFGEIHCCHIKSGGVSRKADAEFQVPMCLGAHQLQHNTGIKSFARAFGLDLAALAAGFWAKWREVAA